MPQQHSLPHELVVCIVILLTWLSLMGDGPAPAWAEDWAELSLTTPRSSQSVSAQDPQPLALLLRSESGLAADLFPSTRLPIELGKETAEDEVSPRKVIAPSLSWEGQGQAGESFFINLQPHFTRNSVETARSPLDQGENYQKSPLNSNDLIYGLGVGTDYELAPWLHFNSAFRFNVHNGRSNPGSSAASPGENMSHSLFFGVTVPFSTSSEE